MWPFYSLREGYEGDEGVYDPVLWPCDMLHVFVTAVGMWHAGLFLTQTCGVSATEQHKMYF